MPFEEGRPDWTPPGPGSWELDSSHSPPAPTRLFRRVCSEAAEIAYRQVFEDLGGPLDTFELRFVHGKLYRRLRPLVGGDRDGGPPPKAVLWLAARLHPAFRRRERTAQATIATKSHLAPIDDWADHERQNWIDANRALQAVDLGALDDDGLADHLDTAIAHNRRGWIRHHVLHATDMGPIGELLTTTNELGVDPVVVMDALQGASPATVEAAEHAAEIAGALAAGGVDPAGLDDLDAVRAVPAAADSLDRYLDTYAWRVVTSYDIEGHTVGEMPGATVAMIRRAADRDDSDRERRDAEARTTVLDAVPADRRADLTEQLDDARRAYGLRDDNGPLTAEWPMGLIRRAYLEAGGRLTAAGRLSGPGLVFELDSPELADLLRGRPAPDTAELEDRAAERRWEAQLDPPLLLGPPADPPDSSVLPPGMRRMVDATVACVELLEPPPVARPRLEGTGIGRRPYTGVARVAASAEEVIDRMEPGDVLVAAWTAPTYNSVMAIAGGLVVQEGGVLCHAAVMARELDIPAVVGAGEAMTAITDGDLVEVDPAAGRVQVLARGTEGPS